jgi:hypothetical protein
MAGRTWNYVSEAISEQGGPVLLDNLWQLPVEAGEEGGGGSIQYR